MIARGFVIERHPQGAKPYRMLGRFDTAADAQAFIKQMGWKARPVPTGTQSEEAR